MSKPAPVPEAQLDPELADLERRTWRFLGDDGLADLMLGLGFLCFGAGMVWQLSMLAALGPAVCVMNWKPLHERFIVPRRGVVRLRPERQRLIRGAMRRMMLLQIVLVLGGLGAWQIMAHDSTRERLTNVMPMLVMIPFPLILAYLGKCFDLPRMFVQAGILLVLILALHFAANAAEGWPLLISGALLFVHGSLLLLRFFRLHPRPGAA